MKINLGYVAIALGIQNGSPNKTITYKSFSKLPDESTQLYKLKSLSKENLDTTRRILIYNKAHNIKMYRFTSKLIPLATHPDVIDWDYIDAFQSLYAEIGRYIKDNCLRISAHPDHFTLLNSPHEDVIRASLVDLKYHCDIFDAMDLSGQDAKLVLHIGGTYGNKKKAIHRFINNFGQLDQRYKERIILENDDKSFTTKEVLEICQILSVPMVLDIHHHWCNNNHENLTDLLPEIFSTWKNQKHVPKVHVSSPRDEKNVRAHADYLDYNFLLDFLMVAKELDIDFDVMIEAKKKDLALFELMKQLKDNKKVDLIDDASFKI